ncbi:hypothetical protein GCM10009754_20200 [Amycolatopsis minnesotensis]|uniref:Secreted protein n=2 Tax=Amycolatopsis minnesotensis TaxID=337894 RepID=A0ABP5BRR1_9PSEU
MSVFSKVFATVAVSGAIGASALAGSGTSEAATTYNFRFSQFGSYVADICIVTDADNVCSGKWPYNKSEVKQVKANSPDGWKCEGRVQGGKDLFSGPFSRNEFKECIMSGLVGTHSMKLERPDGSTKLVATAN